MAKRELRLARLLKRLAKFRPLIIDDIGYVQQDREEMEVLFTLLAERYGCLRRSLLIKRPLFARAARRASAARPRQIPWAGR